MSNKAIIVLEKGPLDGAEIRWPNNGGDFPTTLQFGFDRLLDPAQPLTSAGVIRYCKYIAYQGEQFGPISNEDGLPENEVQYYLFAGESDENAESISDLWSKE